MAGSTVVFAEEDTLFRLMETALNRTVAPQAERALHYFFGEDIRGPVDYLKNLKTTIGLPEDIRGVICEDEERLGELGRDADFLVVERAVITRDMLERWRGRLKLIQKFGSDYRDIDTVAAREMGIPVANLLRLSTISVAEHVILMLLALARNIVKAHHAALARRDANDGSRSEGPPKVLFNWGKVPHIQLLSGKTLGLIGFGENGQQVAWRAHALGMKIRYFQRNRAARDIECSTGARYVPDLIHLMEGCDFISIHVPYGPQTERMITYDVLTHMKPGACFVNIARGGLVDERGLYRILSEKRIAGAALDVYRWEPVPADSPLLTLDTVVWSTHNAGGAPEFMLEESRAVLQNIARVLKGQEPEGWVNRP
ncbi:MAG TPA: NAD(P)-dependent oxidoreductase [Syntrophorhabdales bacterium]|nr:NAD(P)-dependent oxidoreductase [Syntrophorhabdales bacterium]